MQPIPNLHTQVNLHTCTVFKVDLLSPVENLMANCSLDTVAWHDDLWGGSNVAHCRYYAIAIHFGLCTFSGLMCTIYYTAALAWAVLSCYMSSKVFHHNRILRKKYLGSYISWQSKVMAK